MHAIDRRKALTVVASVPAAVALAAAPALAPAGEDRLLTLLRQYERELAIIDSIDSPSWRRINAWQRRAEGILGEAATLPCLSAASAVAVLNLIVRDEMLESCSIFSDHFTAIVVSVRNYIDGGAS